MKICPRCNRQFGHEQRFCLEDGTLLTENFDSYNDDAATVLRTNPGVGGSAPKSNVNKIVFAVVALIALGGLVLAGVLLLKNNDKNDATAQANNSADYELKKKELELKERELELKNKEMNAGANNAQPGNSQAQAGKLPPIVTSDTTGTKYSGAIGNSPAIFTLNWNARAKSVSGSYYFTNNPGKTYMISGTNFPAGEADLEESGTGARIKIYKSINGKILCWNGSYSSDGGTSRINLCRYR